MTTNSAKCRYKNVGQHYRIEHYFRISSWGLGKYSYENKTMLTQIIVQVLWCHLNWQTTVYDGWQLLNITSSYYRMRTKWLWKYVTSDYGKMWQVTMVKCDKWLWWNVTSDYGKMWQVTTVKCDKWLWQNVTSDHSKMWQVTPVKCDKWPQ
jgi:hypothetical protein